MHIHKQTTMNTITPDIFDEIYKNNYKKLSSFAYRLVKDLQKTEDAVQETFHRLNKQDYSHVSENVSAWLFTVCRNYIYKQAYKNNKYVELSDEHLVKLTEKTNQSNDPAEEMILTETKKILLQVLEKLSPREKQIIEYRYFVDIDYSECAKIMHTTENNCHFLHHSAIKKLKTLMSKIP